MKIIRYVDFVIQFLLFGFVIGSILLSLDDFDFGMLLTLQLLVGSYQMTSSFISLVSCFTNPPKLKLLHFVVAVLYLASLTLFPKNLLSEQAFVYYLTIPSWGLGVYYLIASFLGLSGNSGRGKFLPHLSF
jgi:hypothetical protein